MKNTFAALLTALLSGHVAAATLGAHIATAHIPRGEFNNINPGVYARFDGGLTVGAYRNSFRRTSIYAGKTWESGALMAGARVALTAGVISGYEHPLLLVPSLAIGHVRLAYVPPAEKAGSHALHLMLEF
jgi:hypothetical protein